MNLRTAALLSVGISLLMNLLFIIMFFFGCEAVIPPDAAEHLRPWPEFSMLRIAIHFMANFLMLFILYLVNFKILRTHLQPNLKLFLTIAVSIAVTIILSYVLSSAQMILLDKGRLLNARFLFGGLLRDMFMTIIVLFSSHLIYLSHRKQQIVLENNSLMAENAKTRYQALKNQVDPHFLFNSLNTLNSIIKSDLVKAEDYLQQLSYVFRYTLQSHDTLPLKEELKFTEAYCMLMRIRYGDNLRFIFDTDPSLDSYLVVPLSVQTLVGNAIKHNVISSRHKLTVTIITSTADKTLTVFNPVSPREEAEPGSGIGLANLAERYRLTWCREIAIDRGGNNFSVTIPLIEP